MKTIYKYAVAANDTTELRMPQGAQILSVQIQHDIPCVWALVDPGAKVVTRTLRLAGTGHTLPDDPGVYIGTFQVHTVALVFHLFDAGETAGA